MPRRSDIDWEAVEREYRTGQLTVTEIAKRYGIGKGSVSRKAKQCGWTRDHSAEVRLRTKAGMLKQERKETAAETETPERKLFDAGAPTAEDIELAVQTNIAILREHRKTIAEGRELTMRMMGELSDITTHRGELAQMIASDMKQEGATTRRSALKAISLPQRAATMRDLAQAAQRWTQMERTAFNLGAEEEATYEDALKELHERE